MAGPVNPKENQEATPGWTPPGGRGIALGIAAPVLWSSSGMFIKLLSLPALPLTSLRSAIAALVFLPMLGDLRRIRWRPEPAFLGLMISFTAMSLTFVMATKWTTAANAIALQSTAPFWIFILTCLIARRVLWENLPPVLLILAGLGVLLIEPGDGTTVLGNLAGAASGLAFALTSFFFSRVHRPGPEVMFFINAFVAGVLFALQPSHFDLGGIDTKSWLSLIYLGAIQTGMGHLCHYLSLRQITVSQASILALLEPLLNPVWVFLAVAEVPSTHGFVGGGLVLSGIAFDSWRRLKHPRFTG